MGGVVARPQVKQTRISSLWRDEGQAEAPVGRQGQAGRQWVRQGWPGGRRCARPASLAARQPAAGKEVKQCCAQKKDKQHHTCWSGRACCDEAHCAARGARRSGIVVVRAGRGWAVPAPHQHGAGQAAWRGGTRHSASLVRNE
ncbi:hypothetical protein E2C01_068791 [Portunus trituberculatus]|uniref:Uncharacterized protein n=1 Tax=Portunus trituberculatus TaxID=210409 RepID=A0A5B7HWW0_PORTR|nr:hypothetical protein [Portunus trituberculatus]